jgi:prefoldin subunit 5
MSKKLKNMINSIKESFDVEKKIEKKKLLLKNKIEQIKRLAKAKKEVELLQKELEQLQDDKNN